MGNLFKLKNENNQGNNQGQNNSTYENLSNRKKQITISFNDCEWRKMALSGSMKVIEQLNPDHFLSAPGLA